MSQRIQNKRSSILGKRPDGRFLEPGEIALNTNVTDPGLYFEANDGSIAKAGPTAIGVDPPNSDVGYGNGEMWYDSGNGTLNVFSSIRDEFFPTLSPFFGGSETAIFVGTEYPEATDDLSNDGIARPFATVNRACLEVARRSILRNRDDDPLNNRFTIVLLPGRNVVHNEPGIDSDTYIETEPKFVKDQAIESKQLSDLNPVAGGLPLPRGTSIVGLDLRKTILVPTYYPEWTREMYLDNPDSIADRTSVLKWTGNSFITAVTFFDKVSEISVEGIDFDEEQPGVAVLKSLRPHGLKSSIDQVTLIYPEKVPQTYDGVQTLDPSVPYYAEPIDPFRFRLRKSSSTGTLVQRTELPEFPAAGTSPSEFLRLTIQLGTHHRLSALAFVGEEELNSYYSKVQHSFGDLDFGNTLDNAEVGKGETVIVNPVPTDPQVGVDTVSSGSPYAFNLSLRSNFGMCGMTHDGDIVRGFRSALSANFTCVSLQNDPEVFEVYISTQDRTGWFSLREAAAFSASTDPAFITDSEALTYLIQEVDLQYLRYFYRDADDVTIGGETRSSGLPDGNSDTRHYHTLCEGDAITQVVASFAIGAAVNYWAKDGGRITVANANSNFGGQALRSEGFSGIGTSVGALPPDQGFTVQGIRCPRLLTNSELSNNKNHLQLFLNAGIASLDPANHTIRLDKQVDVSVIYPYTLKAGTAIWTRDLSTGAFYSAILENFTGTASPVSEDQLTIQLSSESDNITSVSDAASLETPFVRRLLDPRTEEERSYYLWIQNTSQTHRPPQSSYVVRYSSLPQSGTERLIFPGRQLDPGQSGGWNQTFTVAGSITKEDGDNPNISPNQNIPSKRSSGGYYVALRLADSFGPWVGDYVLPEDAPEDATIPGYQQYNTGSIATSNSYAFYARNAELQIGENAVDPSAQTPNSWTPTKPYEYEQLVGRALIPSEQNPASADPWTETYADDASYIRGIGVERESYFAPSVIDFDNGTENLGLAQPGQPYGDPELIDPDYAHSKLAAARFIRLLGYSQEGVDNLLQPRRSTLRNVRVGESPWPRFIPNEGNAEAQGNWSIEFNQPSSILSVNHTFEWCGYFNYSKGLPRYQTSPLSRRLRFDNIISEAWGGVTVTTGANESNEFIITGFDTVGGDGKRVDDGQQTIGDEGDFVLRAGDNMTGDLTLGG